MSSSDLISLEVKQAIDFWKSSVQSVDGDYAFETMGWTRPGNQHNDKCLPYDDFRSMRQLQKIGCYLFEQCPTVKSAISKMVSYVVSAGHTYSVVRKTVPKKVSRGISVSDAVLEEIKVIVAHTMDTCYPGGWRSMQEESIIRLYREGEYFRRIFVTADDVQVRFIEPAHIKSPSDDPKQNVDLGIITSPGDAVDVTGYWLMGYDDKGNRNWTALPASEVQHAKQGVDANDPRGVPVLWTTYCQSERMKSINEAMCKLAVTQAAYAVVRQYDNSITLDRMRDIASGFNAAKAENGGTPIPGTEVEAKGFSFEFPSMDVDARSFVEIIQQQQRDVAGILDMPEFMLSADASSGNRASLVSAEGPFDRRVQREQAALGRLDTEVLWAAVQSYMGWSDERTSRVRSVVSIEAKAPRPSSRDEHKQAQMLLGLVEAGLKSPQSAIAELGGEYAATQTQIDYHNETFPDRQVGQGERAQAPVPGGEPRQPEQLNQDNRNQGANPA